MSEQFPKVIGKSVSFLASTISGKVGDNILEACGDKVKLNQLEKFTESQVKEVFYTTKNQIDDTINLIKNYIYINTTINLKFSFQRDLSSEEENELWDDFVVYFKKECGDKPSDTYKSKLIYCVNQHNKKFKELFLDNKTSFLAQLIKENSTTNKNIMINVAEINHLVTEINTKVSKETEHIQMMRESLEYGLRETKTWLVAISVLIIFSSGILSWIWTAIDVLTYSIIKIISFVLVIFLIGCLIFIGYSIKKIFNREKTLYQYNLKLADIEFEQYIDLANKKIFMKKIEEWYKKLEE